MRIDRLQIENYRQYGQLDLDLSRGGDVAVVVGSNGTGKTNLLNAIIWCLYKREDYYAHDMESSPQVHQKTVDDAADGALMRVRVALDVSFESGAKASIERTQEFVKHGRSPEAHADQLKIIELRDTARGFQTVPNPDHWIERHVPSRLEPYFLFDGERLDNFFRHAEAKKVQDAVLQIAQIDLLGKLIAHLDNVGGTLYSKAGKSAGGTQMEDLAQRLDLRQGDFRKAVADISQREQELARCDDAVRMLEAKIGNIAEVMADIKRRKRLEQELDGITTSLDEAWQELDRWTVQSAPGVLTFGAVGALQHKIGEARNDRMLPPPVAPRILEELLEKAECVCGSSLDEGSDGRTKIESLLAEYAKVNELGEELLELEPGLHTLTAWVQAADQAAKSHTSRIQDWESRREKAAEDLELLGRRLAGHEDSQVQAIEAELRKAKDEVERARLALAKRQIESEHFRDEADKIERELERLAGKEEKIRSLMHEAQFARRCLDVARGIYRELTNEVRERVAETLQSHFLKMTWKREGIQSVGIDDQYRVSVRNHRGWEILNGLSSGERECLALAFSLALSEVSGFELPMVIDTPMGRLNPDVQAFMARVLAESTRDGDHTHQLLLLMTEAEYNEEVKRILATRKPRVFRLDFDPLDSVTLLSEVS
jgi:DNA sulfur modification protein DndD